MELFDITADGRCALARILVVGGADRGGSVMRDVNDGICTGGGCIG